MAAREEPLWEREDELVADLVQLGLTRNEARLYLAAEGRPPLRAAELAELAGITRTKAYDALHHLVARGMLRQEPGRVARFQAADPLEVARQLRQQGVEDQAMLVADTGALVADLFARYYATPASGDPFDFVELIRNREAALARREAIVAGADAEVLLAEQAPAGAAAPAGPREGLRRRSLYPHTALDAPASATWSPSARRRARRSASPRGSPSACAWSTGASASSASTAPPAAREAGWSWSTRACRPPSATPSTSPGRVPARRGAEARAQAGIFRVAQAIRFLTGPGHLPTVRVFLLPRDVRARQPRGKLRRKGPLPPSRARQGEHG